MSSPTVGERNSRPINGLEYRIVASSLLVDRPGRMVSRKTHQRELEKERNIRKVASFGLENAVHWRKVEKVSFGCSEIPIV